MPGTTVDLLGPKRGCLFITTRSDPTGWMFLACAGSPTAPCNPSPSPCVPFSFTDFSPTTHVRMCMWMQSTVLSAGRWASIYLILLLLWVLRSLGCLWCLYDLGMYSALAGSCVKCDQRALGARRATGSSQCAHHLPSSTLIGPMCVASWERSGKTCSTPAVPLWSIVQGPPCLQLPWRSGTPPSWAPSTCH